MHSPVDFRLGNRVLLKATAQTTSAGQVTTGLMVSTMLVAATFLVHTASGWRTRRCP